MFDFRHAKWIRSTCSLTSNISVRLWHSNKKPDTYRVDLFWQDDAGSERVKVYSRYFMADNSIQALSACGPVIARWLAKQTKVPKGMYPDTWNDVREQFGLDRLSYEQFVQPGKDTK